MTLDRDAGEFRGGEIIAGTLEASVQEACECRKLSVRIRWRAKSRYEEDEGALPDIVLDSGDFQPGQIRTHRFALELPSPVWTYRGSTFSLEYAVHASADLVNKSDPHAELPITLSPSPAISAESIAPNLGMIMQAANEPVAPLAAQRSIIYDQVNSRFQPGCMLVFGIFSLLMAIPFLATSFFLAGTLLPLAREVGPFMVIPIVVWMVLGVGIPGSMGVILLYLGARPFAARWLIGDVTIDLPDRLLAPGASASYRVSFQPKRELDIQQVTVTLRARETVWRRGKNSRRATYHTLRAEERTLEGARHVRPGDYVELAGRLDVPTDAPFSLGAPNHWVTWHLVVNVALRGWIDHETEHIITIAPITTAED